MKAMKNIFRLLILSLCAIALTACGESYNPLPPKTDASVQYALPYPERPQQSEIDDLLKIRAEHENAIK